jgi:hypothetical protein
VIGTGEPQHLNSVLEALADLKASIDGGMLAFCYFI